MPFTPDELGAKLGPEVRELVERISKAKRAIKDIDNTTVELKAQLKKILHTMIAPDEKGHHTVLVDGVKAKVYTRKGSLKPDADAAKRLLHPNTYNAIFTQGKPSLVLDVDPARIPPAYEELFETRTDEDFEDDYYE
jgi:hypothetical protein